MINTSASRTAAMALLVLGVAACDSSTDTEEAATVTLAAGAQSIFIGDTLHLTVTARDGDGDIINDPAVDYGSSEPSVAQVGDDGVVTGISEGVTTVSATVDGVMDELDVEVFDPNGPCFTGTRITVPGSVDGTLEEGDCTRLLQDGSFVDLWFFDLETTAQVTITMSSDELDAYLFLEDGSFNFIGEDDDSGAGTDARIVANLEPGTYWVWANTFPDESGDYTITVEVNGGAILRDGGLSGPSGDPHRLHPAPREPLTRRR
ncbi:MAG TPA: Ig-like domain-containing protein [Longimicrobiales bacterium]|nr:Ig-like domain-containing protein [Longimicrobiales bacterium]